MRSAFLGGATAVLPGCAAPSATPAPAPAARSSSPAEKYAKLDEVLKQPVLKRELFSSPVVIDTLELLHLNNNFLCRVRSKDGAEGISAANNSQQRSLFAIQVNRLQPFFIGKDARDLDRCSKKVYVYESNYKLQSLALWVPLATIEFAILDMLGRIAKKSMGQLVGEIHNPKVAVYRANGERDNSAEAVMDSLKKQVAESQAKALKIKIGGRMSHVEYPAGRSEKLIPMVRKEFGDQMVCYADSNGSYDVAEGIKFGKLLEEYRVRVLRRAGAVRLVRGNEGGEGRRADSGRRRGAGGQHARLPLAHRQRRARYHPGRHVLLRRVHPLHEGGAHVRGDGEGAHPAHLRRAGLPVHDSFRFCDSERGPVSRVQGSR